MHTIHLWHRRLRHIYSRQGDSIINQAGKKKVKSCIVDELETKMLR